MKDYIYAIIEVDRVYLEFSRDLMTQNNPLLRCALDHLVENTLQSASPGWEIEFPELYERLSTKITQSYLNLLALVDHAAAQ